MKKTGFTLAEILISLAIIGIIAAVVTPSLAINAQNRANAAKLSTAASTIENALGMMILKEDVDDISETAFVQAAAETDAIAALQRYAQVEPIDGYTGGLTDNNIVSGHDVKFQLKNGAVLYLKKNYTFTNETHKNKPGLGDMVAQQIIPTGYDVIYFDVNGNDKPNKVGRDLFAYFVNKDNGSLVPFGSAKSNDIENNGKWNDARSDYTCTTEHLSLGCTARLAEHGYKVDY